MVKEYIYLGPPQGSPLYIPTSKRNPIRTTAGETLFLDESQEKNPLVARLILAGKNCADHKKDRFELVGAVQEETSAKEATDVDTDGTLTIELDKMTKKDLITFAANNGIDVQESWIKDKIIKTIEKKLE